MESRRCKGRSDFHIRFHQTSKHHRKLARLESDVSTLVDKTDHAQRMQQFQSQPNDWQCQCRQFQKTTTNVEVIVDSRFESTLICWQRSTVVDRECQQFVLPNRIKFADLSATVQVQYQQKKESDVFQRQTRRRSKFQLLRQSSAVVTLVEVRNWSSMTSTFRLCFS